MNQTRHHGLSRRYQQELIEFGSVMWFSKFIPTQTLPLKSGRYLLFTDDIRIPRLLTGEVGSGYEIQFAILNGEVIYTSPDASSIVTDDLISEISEVKFQNNPALIRSIRFGHKNFAHTLWNQLPALVELESLILNQISLGRIRVEIPSESNSQIAPLGTLRELSPLLADHFSIGNSEIPEFNAIPIGSTFLTESARKRVANSLLNENPKAKKKPVLWLGVDFKTPVRAPENHIDLYVQVALEWLRRTDGDVIVDSFTPETFPISDPNQEKHIAHAAQLVSTIVAKVAVKSGIERIQSTQLLNLRAVLALAEQCDYYLSCPGTIQHKVGWLWPKKPGMIVFGPFKHRSSHVLWHSKQVEGGEDIDELPAELLRFTDGTLDMNHGTCFDTYQVENTQSAAAEIVSRAIARFTREE
ncbi:MAG: hypothetical protein WCR08_09995 [Gammaproteobacteria bacterium]